MGYFAWLVHRIINFGGFLEKKRKKEIFEKYIRQDTTVKKIELFTKNKIKIVGFQKYHAGTVVSIELGVNHYWLKKLLKECFLEKKEPSKLILQENSDEIMIRKFNNFLDESESREIEITMKIIF